MSAPPGLPPAHFIVPANATPFSLAMILTWRAGQPVGVGDGRTHHGGEGGERDEARAAALGVSQLAFYEVHAVCMSHTFNFTDYRDVVSLFYDVDFVAPVNRKIKIDNNVGSVFFYKHSDLSGTIQNLLDCSRNFYHLANERRNKLLALIVQLAIKKPAEISSRHINDGSPITQLGRRCRVQRGEFGGGSIRQFAFVVAMQNPICLIPELHLGFILGKNGLNRCELLMGKAILAIYKNPSRENQFLKGRWRITRIGRRYLDGLLYGVEYSLNLLGKRATNIKRVGRAWNIKRNKFGPSGEISHDTIWNLENRAILCGLHGQFVTHTASRKVGVEKLLKSQGLSDWFDGHRRWSGGRRGIARLSRGGSGRQRRRNRRRVNVDGRRYLFWRLYGRLAVATNGGGSQCLIPEKYARRHKNYRDDGRQDDFCPVIGQKHGGVSSRIREENRESQNNNKKKCQPAGEHPPLSERNLTSHKHGKPGPQDKCWQATIFE